MKVHLSCDKGRKKGVGHFVKHSSRWDDTVHRVFEELLDINTFGRATLECPNAIVDSLKKVFGREDFFSHGVKQLTVEEEVRSTHLEVNHKLVAFALKTSVASLLLVEFTTCNCRCQIQSNH